MAKPFLIYGLHPVLEMLRADPASVRRVLVADNVSGQKLNDVISLAKPSQTDITRINRRELTSMTGDVVHQGVAIEMAPFQYAELDHLFDYAERKGEKPLFLALDHIQDPHNFGALARSAFALGAHGIIVPRDRSCPITPTVIKASAGAIVHLPVVQVTNLGRTINELKEKGLWVVGTLAEEAQPLSTVDLKDAIVLVVGSEGEGLRQKTARLCDFRVTIPMSGDLGSLNASVAGGICLYEASRQRQSS